MRTTLLIAVLATVAGVVIVGVGGGLIKPMQHRWEGYLTKAEEEAPRIKQQVATAPGVAEQAQQAKDRLQTSSASRPSTGGATSVSPATGTAAPGEQTSRY